MNLKHWVKAIGVISMAVTLSAYAESAPVFDVDSFQQQFENGDQGQDLPPPPAPEQRDEGFVPVQTDQIAPKPSVLAPISTTNLSPEQRMRRMEQQLNNLQANEANARIDSLQDQVQTLRGQVEQLTHTVEQMQAQQKAMSEDVDKRLSQHPNKATLPTETDATVTQAEDSAKVTNKTKSNKAVEVDKPTAETAVTTTTTTTAKKSTVDQPNVAEEQQIYQTAYNLIKEKKYDEAVTALQSMLQKYPSGQFASNAHYWLGELYGLMGKNDQALTQFNAVVKTFPDSPRVSDAQLKVGLIYASESKWSDAKNAFKRVINHYPGTASARLASEQLKQIKQAGH